MKLINHVLDIRKLVQQAMDNRFSKMGIKESGLTPIDALPEDLRPKRQKLEDILRNHQSELEDYAKARQETINECTFTLFNRIAAIKVMEEKELFPEVIKRRPENSNKSFSHNLWLEENPSEKNAERQGLKHFLQSKFNELGENFPLYNENYPYSLMPTADELFNILEAFNAVENDPDCGDDIWKGDDILGWLYENFNAVEKQSFKESGEKTEYDKVTLQSQFYTPRWVVKFLVDNSLGRYYLEMYPDSEIVKPDDNGDIKYKIANAPSSRKRDPKKMEEIRVIDPACGSGNFLIYTFDLLYDMYLNQIEQYNADYSRRDIPRLILENNIYGVDLDERAVQLSQIALFIKSRELGGRRAKIASRTNVVSTHFFLPDYSEVESEFIASGEWDQAQRETIRKIWSDLQNAHKFGSLVRVEEVLNGLSLKEDEGTLFATEMEQDLFSFKRRVTDVLHDQVKAYCEKNTSEYALTKAEDAMTFLRILSMPFDVAIANPPYTDSAVFGTELKEFIDSNYRGVYKCNSNLYASFIKRCCELIGENGKVGMVNPPTFMYIKTFEGLRDFILSKTHISLFVEWGYLGMFSSTARVDSALFILDKGVSLENSSFIKLNDIYEGRRYPELLSSYDDLCFGKTNRHLYSIPQTKLKKIKSYPFIYWISDDFRNKFSSSSLDDILNIRQGGATGNNERVLRFFWEIKQEDISRTVGDKKPFVFYPKGGPFNKWYGNNWLVIGYNDPSTYQYLITHGNRLPSKEFYLKEGVTYGSSGSRGTGGYSFRYMPANQVISGGGSGIYPSDEYTNISYYLGFLNTKLSSYLLSCLNPTVNLTQGDLKRIPFARPSKEDERVVQMLVEQNIDIKKDLARFSLLSPEFETSPINPNLGVDVSLDYYLEIENNLLTIVILNDAIINHHVFKVYELNEDDVKMVIEKEGEHIGNLPISLAAKEYYSNWLSHQSSVNNLSILQQHIESLEIASEIHTCDFTALYQDNNDWEKFCIRNVINPIEASYQFEQQRIKAENRKRQLVFELIVDVVRTVLSKDDDGIIPLMDRLGEERLILRIEQELFLRGYSMGSLSQLSSVLGETIESFLESHFFEQLSNYLNLFDHLPKTPFIWHITSGPNHSLDVFVSIYQWNRNALFRIKSIYAANRESVLKDKLSSLDTSNPIEKMESNLITEQLQELKQFVSKIDDLLSSGYSPKIEDGVGKNIAPLQSRGMLSYEVLNSSQLKKYLNADW